MWRLERPVHRVTHKEFTLRIKTNEKRDRIFPNASAPNEVMRGDVNNLNFFYFLLFLLDSPLPFFFSGTVLKPVLFCGEQKENSYSQPAQKTIIMVHNTDTEC
jgi:hypothetical protein